jgi:hypothetical protein
MTAELSRPSFVGLNMPKDGPLTPVGNSNALTILLDRDNRAYYYQGNWKEAVATNKIFQTNLSFNNGFGNVIRDKQQWLDVHSNEGRNGLMLLIKANKEASYKNIVGALDETMINIIQKYTVLPATPEETEWMSVQKR